jgi:hypothetical protein
MADLCTAAKPNDCMRDNCDDQGWIVGWENEHTGIIFDFGSAQLISSVSLFSVYGDGARGCNLEITGALAKPTIVEDSCNYAQHPCVCQLRCPTGQARYGDGSACEGGGVQNCDLGYCHGNPNGGMEHCAGGSKDGWVILDAAVYETTACGSTEYPVESSRWLSSVGKYELDTEGLLFEGQNPGSYLFNDRVKLLKGFDIGPQHFPALTIEIWVRVNSILEQNGWIVGADNGGFDRAIVLHDARYGGIAAPGGSVYQSSLGYPPVGEWLHIVATFENGHDCKVYLNYRHQDVRATNNDDGGLPDMSIGGLQNYEGHAGDVSIAEVRLYSRRLSDSDVFQLYQASCEKLGAFKRDTCALQETGGICLDSFSVTQNQDCGGNDIETIDHIDWTNTEDLESCAARCMELEECTGYNFGHDGKHRDNEECNIKRDCGNCDNCAQSETWDFYRKNGPDPGCSAHNDGGIPVHGGCRDGSVEAVFSNKVSGCDTSWKEMGLQEAENACANGWHICLDADETELNGLTAAQCSNVPGPGTFYGTYQSSGGNFDCNTSGENDIWGCGADQDVAEGIDFTVFHGHPCGVLQDVIGKGAKAGTWENLEADGGHSELATVRKPGQKNGGVMCCFAGEDEGAGLVSNLIFEDVQGRQILSETGPVGMSTSAEKLGNGQLQIDEGGKQRPLSPTRPPFLPFELALAQDL